MRATSTVLTEIDAHASPFTAGAETLITSAAIATRVRRAA